MPSRGRWMNVVERRAEVLYAMIECRGRRKTRTALRRILVTRLFRLLNFDLFQLKFVPISGLWDRGSKYQYRTLPSQAGDVTTHHSGKPSPTYWRGTDQGLEKAERKSLCLIRHIGGEKGRLGQQKGSVPVDGTYTASRTGRS